MQPIFSLFYRPALVTTMALLLMACSQQQLDKSIGWSYPGNRFSLERQRQFTIAPSHNLAVLLKDSSTGDTTGHKEYLMDLAKGLDLAFGQGFASHTMVESMGTRQARAADFIVKVELLGVTSQQTILLRPTEEEGDEARSSEAVVEEEVVEEEVARKGVDDQGDTISIHRFSSKIILLDANSQQVLDIALLNARSGQVIEQETYQAFAHKAFGYYINSLSPRGKTIKGLY